MSRHVPEEETLGGTAAGVRWGKSKTGLSSWEIFKELEGQQEEEEFSSPPMNSCSNCQPSWKKEKSNSKKYMLFYLRLSQTQLVYHQSHHPIMETSFSLHFFFPLKTNI